MTAMTIVAPNRRRTVIAAVLALIVVALGLARGADIAFESTTGPSTGGGYGISDDVPTSFGIVAVEYIRAVDGVTHRALNGASHGVSGLVDGDHAQIQTAVAITNTTAAPITYTSKQFKLLVTKAGKTTVQDPSGGDLPDMRIMPRAGIEGHLSFVVPRSGARLALQFTDPGQAVPIVIDLGAADFTRKSDPHLHSTSTR
jgi:hypothetical protein